MKERPENVPVYLYRHYDAAGALLYVGIAKNVGARFSEHKRKSPWAAHSARMTVETFPDRAAAAVAELQAVVNEKPLYNVGHLEKPAAPKPTVPCPTPLDRTRHGEPSIMISARLPISLVDALNTECTRGNTTRSDLLTRALKEFLASA